jgi:hypothetical protein
MDDDDGAGAAAKLVGEGGNEEDAPKGADIGTAEGDAGGIVEESASTGVAEPGMDDGAGAPAGTGEGKDDCDSRGAVDGIAEDTMLPLSRIRSRRDQLGALRGAIVRPGIKLNR